MFITAVLVSGGGVVQDFIKLKCVSNIFPSPHVCKWGGQNIRNTSPYNAVHFSTTANYNLSNKHTVKLIPLNECFERLNLIPTLQSITVSLMFSLSFFVSSQDASYRDQ